MLKKRIRRFIQKQIAQKSAPTPEDVYNKYLLDIDMKEKLCTYFEEIMSEYPELWMYSPKQSVEKILENDKNIKKCRCLDSFSGNNWYNVLQKHPHLITKSKKYNEAWGGILVIKPELAEKCDFSSLSTKNWNLVLKKRPEFIDEWEKLYFHTSRNAALLLTTNPEFAKEYGSLRFPLDILDLISEKQPQSWIYINQLAVKVLKKDPTKISECKCKFDNLERAELLSVHPSLKEHIGDLEDFIIKFPTDKNPQPEDIALYLSLKPECAFDKYFSTLNLYNKNEYYYTSFAQAWIYLLKHQPQFIKKCEWPDQLRASDCYELFSENPDLYDAYHEIYSELGFELPSDFGDTSEDDDENTLKEKIWNWCNLLKIQPQLADKCLLWEYFDIEDWGYLLDIAPSFLEKAKECNYGWTAILKSNILPPNECQWDKISYSNDLIELLFARPQLTEYFTDVLWDRLSQEDWEVLEAQHPGVFEEKHMLSALRKLAK